MFMQTFSTARSAKAAQLQASYADFGHKFSVAAVDDLATSDLTEAFAGNATRHALE